MTPTRKDVLAVLDGEHDATSAQRVAGAFGSPVVAAGLWNFVSPSGPWLMPATDVQVMHDLVAGEPAETRRVGGLSRQAAGPG
jgi:hypothetical protein